MLTKARLLLVVNTVLLKQAPGAGIFFAMGESMSRPSTMPTPEEALPGKGELQKGLCPVVQSIVCFTSSLRGQLVKYFTTL